MVMTKTAPAALESAIKRAGGILAFARDLGVTHQAVSAWRKRGHVPFDRATTCLLYTSPSPRDA